MAEPETSQGGAAPADDAKRAERRAARQLRRADEIGRTAPVAGTAPAPAGPAAAPEASAGEQPDPAREARKLARIEERRVAAAKAQAAGEPPPERAQFTPEELQRRREIAIRRRQQAEAAARAQAGGAPQVETPPLSPEELQRRREAAIRRRQEKADAAAASGHVEPAPGTVPADQPGGLIARQGKSLRAIAAAAPAAIREVVERPASPEAGAEVNVPAERVSRPPRPGPKAAPAAPPAPVDPKALAHALMTNEERAAAKRAAKQSKAELPPLPDTWRAGLAPELGPMVVAPALRAPRLTAGAQIRAWLAARPGARGALVGACMLLFWELCRLWSGALPSFGDLLFDLALWAVAGLIAWRLLVRREAHHA